MHLLKLINTIVIIGILLSTSYPGTLKGNVNYEGKIPKKKTLKMDADTICGSSHKSKVFN